MSRNQTTPHLRDGKKPSFIFDVIEKNGNYTLQLIGDFIRGSYTTPESVDNPDPRHDAKKISQ
jgi:hypothetical protein